MKPLLSKEAIRLGLERRPCAQTQKLQSHEDISIEIKRLELPLATQLIVLLPTK